MIDLACKTYGIDPSTSFMVGDSVKDIECAGTQGLERPFLCSRVTAEKPKKALGNGGWNQIL